MEFKHELLEAAKDKVTGFKGVILGRTQYATGCNTYGLCPQKLTKEGKRPEWEWFDEERVELTNNRISLRNGDTGGIPESLPPTR